MREKVYLNCVGTFGVTSAGYWRGRAGGAIVRLTHYLLSHEHTLWVWLYSDNGMIASGSEQKELGLLPHMFVLVLLSVPSSWRKVHGGVEAEWIGYWGETAGRRRRG